MFLQMQKNLIPWKVQVRYYKELYQRRFVNDVNDKKMRIPLPFVLLTEDERKFLEQAHLDVENEEEEIGEILPESNINEDENGNLEMLRNINDRDVTFEEAMDIVSEPNEEHQEVQETNKGRQLENDHIVTETGDTYFTTETNDIAHLEVMQKNLDPMEGASPYYKELYKRRFVNDVNDKENAIPQPVSSGVTVRTLFRYSKVVGINVNEGVDSHFTCDVKVTVNSMEE
ncbi:Hypothetical predicted protein [Mytilus galloprovincialis]|uniref:Uncharacterized protein n=1 Tax=Mytilus galloprovincialis TaxID=29158 RepID=A0A8B6HQV8_MYTGA|nr:Hypothetical predicted protein [Mytilus galloprovincialis]